MNFSYQRWARNHQMLTSWERYRDCKGFVCISWRLSLILHALFWGEVSNAGRGISRHRSCLPFHNPSLARGDNRSWLSHMQWLVFSSRATTDTRPELPVVRVCPTSSGKPPRRRIACLRFTITDVRNLHSGESPPVKMPAAHCNILVSECLMS